MQTGTKHVLLVEDEEAHAELIQLSFQSRDDIELVVASSLEEARGQLAGSTPDLLILDSLLPDGRGLELLQGLPRVAPCPVILLTSHADGVMQAEAVAAGAAKYVVKSDATLFEMPEIADGVLRDVEADS